MYAKGAELYSGHPDSAASGRSPLKGVNVPRLVVGF